MQDEILSDDVNWFPRDAHRDARLDVALVHCPSCDGKAEVRSLRDERGVQLALRLTCFHCGHNQTAHDWADAHAPWLHYMPSMSLRVYNAGAPPFDAPLWLETVCCGNHRLWALNEQHLDYLADYVASTQREREFPSPSGDRQLAYKLPTWMKRAKNRDEILRAIARLRATL